MSYTLQQRLEVLRTRLIVLTFQHKDADTVSAETIKIEMRNVLQAIAYLEAEIRIEGPQEVSEWPIRGIRVYETSFDRTIEKDFRNIRSVCKSCGTEIIASVIKGLTELEAIHWSSCKDRSQSTHSAKFTKAS
jgi:hypothetical protein